MGCPRWIALFSCCTVVACGSSLPDSSADYVSVGPTGEGDGGEAASSADPSDPGATKAAAPTPDPPVTPPSSSPAPPSCDVSKPFLTPKLVPGVSGSGNTSNARLSADEHAIFFMRAMPGAKLNQEIAFDTRADREATFGTGAVLTELSSSVQEGSPTLTADGLTMYFHSDRAGGPGGFDLWVSHRGEAAGTWGKPSIVAKPSSTATDQDPFVRPDGKVLFFSSNRSGHYEIYRAGIDAGGVVASASAVSELDTSADETNPVLSADGLAIYFARASSSKDIFVARRAAVTDDFGPAKRIEEVSTGQDDYPSWISADECRLYMTISNLATKSKGIYLAERSK